MMCELQQVLGITEKYSLKRKGKGNSNTFMAFKDVNLFVG